MDERREQGDFMIDDIYYGIEPESGKRIEDLTDDEYRDFMGPVKCSMCARHQKCKRLEEVELARPWFSCSSDGRICKDFIPPQYYKLLVKYWRGVNAYIDCVNPNLTISVCLNHDQSVRYDILYSDFVNDTMFDQNGLKWIYKQYYKQTRSSPFGYKLVTEYNERAGRNEKG